MKQAAESPANQTQSPGFAGAEQVSITWEQIDAYLNGLHDRSYAPETIKNYRRNLKQFSMCCPRRGR